MTEVVRVLIVADNVSARFGGEAFLPLHYFRLLRERGVEAWLLTHQRVRTELEALFPRDRERIHYVPDTPLHIALHELGARLPTRVDEVTLQCASQLLTQLIQRHMAKKLVREHAITVVHSPTPVSPKQPSALFDVGAPVVIGPMNGGMSFPPSFAPLESAPTRGVRKLARAASNLANRILPGKRQAAVLLVANARTEAALPAATRGTPVHHVVENGVDLRRFSLEGGRGGDDRRVRFGFLGRLVDWKGVDLLLEALAITRAAPTIELDVLGDGPERARLTALVEQLGLSERVRFHGFVQQDDAARKLHELDALVLPSLYECGGAVVLEAMASGLPVIATRWGGPADYLDESCGILIDPVSRGRLVSELAGAMARLAEDEPLRKRLGASGRRKVEREYDWDRKLDHMLEIYRDVHRPTRAPERSSARPSASVMELPHHDAAPSSARERPRRVA